MKVAVAVHGRFHGYDLARELHERGALACLLTTYPPFIARRMLPAGVPLRTIGALELLRRCSASLPISRPPDAFIGRRFGRFVARNLPSQLDILVGWSGATLDAIPVARQRGALVVIERGSSHIAHQAEALAAAAAELGLPASLPDDRIIAREVEEYALADRIAVPSQFAVETFVSRGVPRSRLIVNPYGTDLRRFAALDSRRHSAEPLRILLVGQIGLRKGVPWLLRAMTRLGARAELHLVGPVAPYMRPLIASAPGRIVVHGPLRSPDLEAAFSLCDVFCLPSLEEGLPLSMLQAMAAGLPVIVTPETGAADIMANQVEGLIVPPRDSPALADAIEQLFDNDRRLSMGEAARQRVAQGLTWNDYGERAVAAYRLLLSKEKRAQPE